MTNRFIYELGPVFTGGGSGGATSTPTLQEVTDAGNTTTDAFSMINGLQSVGFDKIPGFEPLYEIYSLLYKTFNGATGAFTLYVAPPTGGFTGNFVIRWPNASGTVALLGDLAAYFKNGGNSFGATTVLGTTDANDLNLSANSNVYLVVHNTDGHIELRNSSAEEVLTIANTSNTNGIGFGIGKGTLSPINNPFITFGRAGNISTISVQSGTNNGRGIITNLSFLVFSNSIQTPVILDNATVIGSTAGVVLGLRNGADATAAGNFPTTGVLVWLDVPNNNGNNMQFNPTTGTAKLICVRVDPVINQTGTANGRTIGFSSEPVLTSFVDWTGFNDNSAGGYAFKAENAGSKNAFVGDTTIGSTTVHASAQLAVDSTTQGFAPPRMTSAQRLAIASPMVGLMVYQTDTVEGLYINKSTGWTFVA